MNKNEMITPDIEADAQRVFAVLEKGGVALIPGDQGYALVSCHDDALVRWFKAKGRGSHKRNGMIGNYEIHKSVHVLEDPKKQEMIQMLLNVYNVPFGIVAKVRQDHPLFENTGADVLKSTFVDGTMSIFVNLGKLPDELVKLTYAAGLPLLGSSANLTGSGTKFRLEDVEKEVVEAADIVLDYGTCKYEAYRRSTTMYDFERMQVVRIGACYPTIKDAFSRFFGVEMPDNPGQDQGQSTAEPESAAK